MIHVVDIPSEADHSNHCVDRKELFGGLNVVIVGRLTRSQAEISKLVSSLGGKVVTKVTAEVDLCISKKGACMPTSLSLQFALFVVLIGLYR